MAKFFRWGEGATSRSRSTSTSKTTDKSVRPTRATSKAAGEGARTTHANLLDCSVIFLRRKICGD